MKMYNISKFYPKMLILVVTVKIYWVNFKKSNFNQSSALPYSLHLIVIKIFKTDKYTFEL